MCDWKPSSSQFQAFASLKVLSAPLWPHFSPPLIINGQALDLGFGSGRGLQRKLWPPLPSLVPEPGQEIPTEPCNRTEKHLVSY